MVDGRQLENNKIAISQEGSDHQCNATLPLLPNKNCKYH